MEEVSFLLFILYRLLMLSIVNFFCQNSYCNLYADSKETEKDIFHFESDRWQISVIPTGGQPIAFVNNCHTSRGTHVTYIQNQIIEGLKDRILSSNPDLVEVLTSSIMKSHLTFLINCLIENPRFDSQVR